MTLEVYGRLRDGVSLDQAQLELEGIARQLAAEYPDTNEGIATVLKPYTREYVGDEPVALLYTMLGAVLLVLAIACANVANLLLSRAAQRSKEMAVRSALGASRGRGLVSQVTEVLVLAVLAAVPGLGLAAGGIALFNRALVDNPPPYWMSFRIDGAVLVFTALVTVLAAVLASVVPAWRASGGGSAELLKSDGRSTTGRALGRFSRALVVAEITFSCALLIAAGLTIQSVVRLANADFGFDPAPVWSGRLGLFEKDYPDPESRRRFFAQVEERVAALPAVRAAALASVLPATEHDGMRFHWEGETPERVADLPWIRHAVVTPAYFDMLQVAAVEGRLLQPGDRDERLPVALVNRAFVARFSPGESPVGRRLRLAPQDPEEPVRTIVGVVPDLHMEGFDDETPEGVFVPLEQSDMRFASVLVRVGDGQPQALTAAVRSAVTELDPNLPLYFVDTLEHAIYSDGWFYWVFGVLFMVFGAVALFLAAVGLYGVMASSVARRTQEVGIRLALGARAEQVLALVLRQGVWQLALGLGLGLLLAAVSARFMSLILFQVEPRDPLTFAAIAVVLAVTGLAACLVPARRAARIDPVVALKNG
jgi:predicted permease